MGRDSRRNSETANDGAMAVITVTTRSAEHAYRAARCALPSIHPDCNNRSIIDAVLPEHVRSYDTFGDDGLKGLYPQEAQHILRAISSRQVEFATGRRCARTALSKLGVPPGPLLSGHRGAPTWPTGVVGSITHCTGYRAAAVASTTNVLALGIDAERAEPLPNRDALKLFATPSEMVRMPALQATCPHVYWDRLLFSAKESLFKAWYPVTGRELSFNEVDVEFDATDGTFAASVLVAGPADLASLTGQWAVLNGIDVTAIVISAVGRAVSPFD